MTIDVKSVADDVLTAFKGVLGPLVGDSAAAAKAQAAALARSLADIEAARLGGGINAAQAQDLLQSAVDDADAALQADVGIAQNTSHAALTAGLKVLETAVLNVTGLGFLQPVLADVVSGLSGAG